MKTFILVWLQKRLVMLSRYRAAAFGGVIEVGNRGTGKRVNHVMYCSCIINMRFKMECQ